MNTLINLCILLHLYLASKYHPIDQYASDSNESEYFDCEDGSDWDNRCVVNTVVIPDHQCILDFVHGINYNMSRHLMSQNVENIFYRQGIDLDSVISIISTIPEGNLAYFVWDKPSLYHKALNNIINLIKEVAYNFEDIEYGNEYLSQLFETKFYSYFDQTESFTDTLNLLNNKKTFGNIQKVVSNLFKKSKKFDTCPPVIQTSLSSVKSELIGTASIILSRVLNYIGYYAKKSWFSDEHEERYPEPKDKKTWEKHINAMYKYFDLHSRTDSIGYGNEALTQTICELLSLPKTALFDNLSEGDYNYLSSQNITDHVCKSLSLKKKLATKAAISDNDLLRCTFDSLHELRIVIKFVWFAFSENLQKLEDFCKRRKMDCSEIHTFLILFDSKYFVGNISGIEKVKEFF